jgi:exopolyphosphatase/guanosine-5'-triphosphate,3'-diphosphate pyrophosphatase
MQAETIAQGTNVQAQTIGVVDLGSNTVHLLVAHSDGQTIIPLVDLTAGLRLGGDVDRTGAISPEKLQDTLASLAEFQAAAATVGVDRLLLIATQAIRIATNSAAVCAAITAATGLPVQVLTPEQEAALAFLAATAGGAQDRPQAVVDIGGGSMQVAVGQHATVECSISLPLGGARLASRFIANDPPTTAEEAALQAYVAGEIAAALPARDPPPGAVIGVGGTVRRIPQLLGQQPGDMIPPDGLNQALALLRCTTAAELAAEYGMERERARLLLPGILVLREVLRGYGHPPLTIAPYGIREGAILRLVRQGTI